MIDEPVVWSGRADREGLLYFSGNAGEEMDALQGHFIPMTDF